MKRPFGPKSNNNGLSWGWYICFCVCYVIVGATIGVIVIMQTKGSWGGGKIHVKKKDE